MYTFDIQHEKNILYPNDIPKECFQPNGRNTKWVLELIPEYRKNGDVYLTFMLPPNYKDCTTDKNFLCFKCCQKNSAGILQKECEYVWNIIKVANERDSIIKKYEFISSKGFCDPIIDWWYCSNKNYIVFIAPYVKYSLEDYLKNPQLGLWDIVKIIIDLVQFILEMHRHNLCYDFSLGNYSVREKDKSIFLIERIRKIEMDKKEKFMYQYNVPLRQNIYNDFIIDASSMQEYYVKVVSEYLEKIFREWLDTINPKILSFEEIVNREENMVQTIKKELYQIKIKDPLVLCHQKKYVPYQDFLSLSEHVDKNICWDEKSKEWLIQKRIFSNGKKDDDSGVDGIIKDYELGSGGYGVVFSGCKKTQNKDCGIIGDEYIPCDDCNYAIKFASLMTNEDDIPEVKMREMVKIYELASQYNLSSEIFDWWICDESIFDSSDYSFVLITRKFKKTLTESLKDPNINFIHRYCMICNAILMLHKLHSIGIYHGDSTTSNFMYDEKNKLYFIDFDLSGIVIPTTTAEVDIMQNYLYDYSKLIESIQNCYLSSEKEINEIYMIRVSNYLKEKLLDPYEKLISMEHTPDTFGKIIFFEKELVDNCISDIPIPSIKYIDRFWKLNENNPN